MGRERSVNDRVRVDVWMLAAVHHRLVELSDDIGWSKTKIVEYAVDQWVSERRRELDNPKPLRDKEVADGVAEVIQ